MLLQLTSRRARAANFPLKVEAANNAVHEYAYNDAQRLEELTRPPTRERPVLQLRDLLFPRSFVCVPAQSMHMCSRLCLKAQV